MISCIIADVDSDDWRFVMEVTGSKSDEELIIRPEKNWALRSILQASLAYLASQDALKVMLITD